MLTIFKNKIYFTAVLESVQIKEMNKIFILK